MNRTDFLQWAATELAKRHPGHPVDEGEGTRAVRCARDMYLGVEALLDGEMRVHVFTDRAQLMLTTAAPTLLLPPPGMAYSVQRGANPPGRLYARLTWRRGGESYVAEQTQTRVALDWLHATVIPVLIPD
ncbi:hypothetical protein F0U60_00160 [Archangium minus]|uniref:Uncharacterized protein n=1 Tax=Archangium minus TaxID=83450 RepID=A0ABY9WGD1_9BACT|nr:hypothetical protein F0U60_00160 [Archangium minus]